MLITLEPIKDVIEGLKFDHRKYAKDMHFDTTKYNTHHHKWRWRYKEHMKRFVEASRDDRMVSILTAVDRSSRLPSEKDFMKKHHIITLKNLKQQLKHHPRAKKWQVIRQKLAQQEDKHNLSMTYRRYFQTDRSHIKPVSYQKILGMAEHVQRALNPQTYVMQEQEQPVKIKHNKTRKIHKHKKSNKAKKQKSSIKPKKHIHKKHKSKRNKRVTKPKKVIKHQQKPKKVKRRSKQATKVHKVTKSKPTKPKIHMPKMPYISKPSPQKIAEMKARFTPNVQSPAYHYSSPKQTKQYNHERNISNKQRLHNYYVNTKPQQRYKLGVGNANQYVAQPHHLHHTHNLSQIINQRRKRNQEHREVTKQTQQPKHQISTQRKREIEAFQRSIGVRR